jgi:pyruvate dehydrogenase E1 component alpha subunit
VSEAFVFAAVFNAPVVFFCQNNQWAISMPTDRQTRNPIHERSAGFGFPGIRVDGNDVLAVMAVTRYALDRARAGEGPTLIEAFTYRMAAHTTSDDPTRYRPAAELDAWRQRDPIDRLRIHLVNEGIADESFLEELEREADELGELVRAGVRAMPDPPPGAMFDNVYAEPHPEIDAQRAEMADYLGSFIDEGVR